MATNEVHFINRPYQDICVGNCKIIHVIALANEKLKPGTLLTRDGDNKYKAVKVKTEKVYAVCLDFWNEASDGTVQAVVSGDVNLNALLTGDVTDSSKVTDYYYSALDNKIFFS